MDPKSLRRAILFSPTSSRSSVKLRPPEQISNTFETAQSISGVEVPPRRHPFFISPRGLSSDPPTCIVHQRQPYWESEVSKVKGQRHFNVGWSLCILSCCIVLSSSLFLSLLVSKSSLHLMISRFNILLASVIVRTDLILQKYWNPTFLQGFSVPPSSAAPVIAAAWPL